MKGSRFSEEQIIAMLKEREAGMPTADVCHKHGVSPATLYKYKAKYGGLEVSDARRLRALEDENGNLKKLLAEVMLDRAIGTPSVRVTVARAILKDVAARDGSVRREAVAQACATHGVEPAPGVSGSVCGPVECEVSQRPAGRFRCAGHDEGGVGRAATVRLSTHPCDAGAAGDRDEPQEAAAALSGGTAAGAPSGQDERCWFPTAQIILWSLDFISDALTDGRRFRVLAVVDDPTRKCLALVANTSLSGQRVVRELDAMIARRGRLAMIVSDNDTKLTLMAILSWCQHTRDRVALHRAQQANARHGFIESFNGRFGNELLDETLFSSLAADRQKIRAWQHDCKHHRPHSGLGSIPPAEFVAMKGLEIRAA